LEIGRRYGIRVSDEVANKTRLNKESIKFYCTTIMTYYNIENDNYAIYSDAANALFIMKAENVDERTRIIHVVDVIQDLAMYYNTGLISREIHKVVKDDL
jgi:hypothetical protein